MTPIVVATVVEGHGEVRALPVLLRRVAQAHPRQPILAVPPPFRLPRGKIANPAELSKAVAFTARRVPVGGIGGVLVLADSDDDCPVGLAQQLTMACLPAAIGRRVEVAFAVREYEAWFLAGRSGLSTHPDVGTGTFAGDAEQGRDAKKRLNDTMVGTYAEMRHQAAFSALLDLGEARARSRSFRHLVSAVNRLLIAELVA